MGFRGERGTVFESLNEISHTDTRLALASTCREGVERDSLTKREREREREREKERERERERERQKEKSMY